MKKRLLSFLLLCVLMTALGCQSSADGDVTIPSLGYITRYSVPDNPAMDFMKQLGTGWNLGNTFDAYQDNFRGDPLQLESYWCGVKTTQEIIQAVSDAGFRTLRIPVSWHNHVSGEHFTIDPLWLDRVQQVADWALEAGMHVVINTHHDVGEKFYYPSSEHYETSAAYISSIWAQVAERFREYDERLIFESMNEPRLVGTAYEWNFTVFQPACQDAMDCINRLNQVFVDTVRASGGKNAGRYLMVPGYSASVGGALNALFKLPEDAADNRIILSVHAYTPYSFALDGSGTDKFSLTSPAQTSEINSFLISLYSDYVSKGVPVVIGEFGARVKNGNLQSRVDFAAFYAASASARNIPCIVWDNNAHTGSGELFGLLDRAKLEWRYPEVVQALVQFGGYDRIPERK